MGHSRSDAQTYRTKEEVNDWKKNRDPIDRMEQYLLEHGVLKEELKEIRAMAGRDVESAVTYADEAGFPGLETITTDVYA